MSSIQYLRVFDSYNIGDASRSRNRERTPQRFCSSSKIGIHPTVPATSTDLGLYIGIQPTPTPIQLQAVSIESATQQIAEIGHRIDGHLGVAQRATQEDGIAGKHSQIATLVERQSRYVMLAKVASKATETVVNALIKHAQKLPHELYKSLTWDRGRAGHRSAEQGAGEIVRALSLGWLTGLEPATTGITIQDSTN